MQISASRAVVWRPVGGAGIEMTRGVSESGVAIGDVSGS
jgi:hypothetical protein